MPKNLEKARIKAFEKTPCPHCLGIFPRVSLPQHQKSCYMKPENQKKCPVCSDLIKKRGNTTCSYSCANTFFRSGKNNPNWNHSNYRNICFTNHKKSCVVCGEHRIVEVHHLDENHENNDPKNLIPLCPTHHKYFHSRYRKYIMEAINEYVSHL